MRSALPALVLLLLAVPAAAAQVPEPQPITHPYASAPVLFSEDLAISPTNPSLAVAPGGRVITARGVPLSSSDPDVATWLHDFETGRTERLGSSESDIRVRGISATGDLLLVGNEVGVASLWQRSTGARVDVVPDPAADLTSLVPVAIGADGRTGWLQWSAVLTDPDQAPTGLATFTHQGDLSMVNVTILDERVPLAGSPDLTNSVRDASGVVELVGPAFTVAIPELGDASRISHAAVTDTQADGSTVVAVISDDSALPGAATGACDGVVCPQAYRVVVRSGQPDRVQLLSVGPDGRGSVRPVTELTLSPSGSLVAFTSSAPLVAGMPDADVANVYAAGTQHLRLISSFETAGGEVLGGHSPAFLTDNDLLFYATLDGSASAVLGGLPVPGLRVATIQPFVDMASSIHEGAIWWAVDEGVTLGCGPDRYCPSADVTRAQLASLVARSLELVPVDDGPFIDVTGTHSGAINALAAAGITEGCAPSRFCPDATTSRAQLATLLARALDLPPAPDAVFTDTGGVHAEAIEALRAAGISNGCAPDRYCPSDPVTRAQAATFLYRAFTGS